MLISRISTGKHQNILIGNFLLLISQLEELLVNFVELLLIINLYAIDMETVLQCSTTRTGCQYDSIVIQSHILRINDFVSLNILQDTILMDTGRMSKCIATHDSLVWLDRHIHQAAHHA